MFCTFLNHIKKRTKNALKIHETEVIYLGNPIIKEWINKKETAKKRIPNSFLNQNFSVCLDIDNNEKDSAIVQGDDNPLETEQRVVIIYGNDIRVMPYEE